MLRSMKTTVQKRILALFCDMHGAELIEFAVSLPLLIVFTMGIYDFSSAFILKQKIAHVTEQAARVAANQPMSDVANTGSCPASICAIRDVVHQALTNNGVNDCGLRSVTPTNAALTWTFIASNANCSGLTLIINRGVTYSVALPNPPFQGSYMVEATTVTLKYPYQWQFNKAINLIAPGANYASGLIQSVATMQNLD